MKIKPLLLLAVIVFLVLSSAWTLAILIDTGMVNWISLLVATVCLCRLAATRKMKPIEFPQQNHMFNAPAHGSDEIHDVPVFADPRGTSIAACFEVSDEELEQIRDTGRIWVLMKGTTWYPMMLTAEMPIADPADYDFPEDIDL